MQNDNVTIRTVAERAGVSISTVSHVLNGNSQHVGAEKRERVLEAVRDLNYRPNAIARSMVKRSTATIGLVITEVTNPLFVPVTEGVEEVLRAEGYHIVLATCADAEGELRAIESLRGQQVDGFIFMSLTARYPEYHLVPLKEAGVPFVVINRDLNDPEVNRVQFDDWGAGRAAALHMIQLGHQRFATITGPYARRRSAAERLRGWQETLREHNMLLEPQWTVDSDYTYAGGYAATQQLLTQMAALPERPTAVFASNESMAVGSLKALSDAGVRVPQELAVVSIGDPPFAAYTVPALTTLSLPVVEAGRVAARILLGWLKNGKPARAQLITLSCTLRVRDSCGANLRSPQK